MMGPAFTLRYMPAREDRNTLAEFQNPQHPQRQAIEQCPAGHVLVMDSRKDARAASAGDIYHRLMMRGAAGVVTDGGFRDSDSIAELDMPSLSPPPGQPDNLTLHEAIDINVPIGCGDAAVFPGDYIVGDNDSVIIVPAHQVNELAEEAEMTAYEDFVTEQVKKGQPLSGFTPARDEHRQAFEKWRKENNRSVSGFVSPSPDTLTQTLWFIV